ncbi:hypothetical protein J2TS6_26600 [Paenibacillus albilobatus]|uniref:Uncharacterized protein n=1 Tax=Paenibacillus albilobatus TaxID=2716884 RepID=A0A919XFA2_9BACL|nr:hypothetical protein J2TS6_26600 [Paenibacillus albilobatus]
MKKSIPYSLGKNKLTRKNIRNRDYHYNLTLSQNTSRAVKFLKIHWIGSFIDDLRYEFTNYSNEQRSVLPILGYDDY